MYIYCHCKITRGLDNEILRHFFLFKIIKHSPVIQTEGFIIYVQIMCGCLPKLFNNY